MNTYKEFVEIFKKDISFIEKINKENSDQRKPYTNEATSSYSKILGFYNSPLTIKLRESIDVDLKKNLQARQKRLESVIQDDVVKQIPYIDEFLSEFNFYLGIISGYLISINIKQESNFKIEEN
jgi:hypothetical protein